MITFKERNDFILNNIDDVIACAYHSNSINQILFPKNYIYKTLKNISSKKSLNSLEEIKKIEIGSCIFQNIDKRKIFFCIISDKNWRITETNIRVSISNLIELCLENNFTKVLVPYLGIYESDFSHESIKNIIENEVKKKSKIFTDANLEVILINELQLKDSICKKVYKTPNQKYSLGVSNIKTGEILGRYTRSDIKKGFMYIPKILSEEHLKLFLNNEVCLFYYNENEGNNIFIQTLETGNEKYECLPLEGKILQNIPL